MNGMVKIFQILLLVSFLTLVSLSVIAESGENHGTTNNLNVIKKSSEGTTAAFPDVCETPSPGGPVPIPYPNIGKSSDTSKGSRKVKMDGNPTMMKDSNFQTSEGDERGTFGEESGESGSSVDKEPTNILPKQFR